MEHRRWRRHIGSICRSTTTIATTWKQVKREEDDLENTSTISYPKYLFLHYRNDIIHSNHKNKKENENKIENETYESSYPPKWIPIEWRIRIMIISGITRTLDNFEFHSTRASKDKRIFYKSSICLFAYLDMSILHTTLQFAPMNIRFPFRLYTPTMHQIYLYSPLVRQFHQFHDCNIAYLMEHVYN